MSRELESQSMRALDEKIAEIEILEAELAKVTGERDASHEIVMDTSESYSKLLRKLGEERAAKEAALAVITNINIGAEQTAERRARVRRQSQRINSEIKRLAQATRRFTQVLELWEPAAKGVDMRNKKPTINPFMQMREQVRLLSKDDRHSLAKAIAIEEADRVEKDSPAMFAWNRMGHAADEATSAEEDKVTGIRSRPEIKEVW